MEAVRTNVDGHGQRAAPPPSKQGVKRVVCLSTDKAAYPINAMGISKAMMEHVITANAPCRAQRGRPGHLLHPLRQRDVQPRQRDSAVCGADQGRQPHYHH